MAIREFDTDGKIVSLDSAGFKTYSYDDAFRITGIADASNGALSQTYGYDLLDRLTGASGTGLNQGWTYDAIGNRLAENGGASSTYTISSSSNRVTSISGALSRSYTYDTAGSITADGTASFVYNDAGRMISATKTGVTTTYAVNALGQRVRKTAGSSSQYFVYDEAGHLIGEYDSAGNLIQETIWLGNIPVATLRPNGAGVTVYYIHTDHLNTPRRVSRPSDNVIVWRWDSDPFGTAAANEDPDGDTTLFSFNLRFPGQYFDVESGWHHNYFREYDPHIGRYMQSDSIGLAGGPNTYAYVRANPVHRFDRFGLEDEDPDAPKKDPDPADDDGSADYAYDFQHWYECISAENRLAGKWAEFYENQRRAYEWLSKWHTRVHQPIPNDPPPPGPTPQGPDPYAPKIPDPTPPSVPAPGNGAKK